MSNYAIVVDSYTPQLARDVYIEKCIPICGKLLLLEQESAALVLPLKLFRFSEFYSFKWVVDTLTEISLSAKKQIRLLHLWIYLLYILLHLLFLYSSLQKPDISLINIIWWMVLCELYAQMCQYVQMCQYLIFSMNDSFESGITQTPTLFFSPR